MRYLCTMAVRLIELRRVLKPTGSLYLHCDPSASHYLKMLLDVVFGGDNFLNEIVWKRTNTHSDSRTWSRVADSILFYRRGKDFTWNIPHGTHSDEYLASKYRHSDADGRIYQLDNMTSPSARPNMTYEWRGFPPPTNGWRYERATMVRLDDEQRIWYPQKGDGTPDTSKRPRLKRYLDEMTGGVMGSVWTDIAPLNSQAQERLGYPTQKPLALLDRIIQTSSNQNDVVLDPFCGCGTTVHSAQRLGRQWIGIDVTHLAISLIERRLKDAFPGIKFDVEGTPKDFDGARDLAARDKYQFQWWAVSLVDAVPQGGAKKKGADRGVDGIRWVRMGVREGDVEQVIVSVKGGDNVGSAMVRDLKGTVEREGAIAGLFITLAEPTREMTREAASSGFFDTSFGRFPKVQILSIRMLLAGMKPELPPLGRGEGFRRAPREAGPRARQTDFGV